MSKYLAIKICIIIANGDERCLHLGEFTEFVNKPSQERTT